MSGAKRLDNLNPKVHETKTRDHRRGSLSCENAEDLDALEVFDYIRDINDPEHPYTLEQLNVVQEELIKVDLEDVEMPIVDVSFTPTIPHCSLAALIGLSIVIKLQRSLAENVKICVHITPGTHSTESAINRQLADKERVSAALENPNVMDTVNRCLKPVE
ncbi:Mitotic spindle-associated MMXD complex subunit MIP18 [Aphelenchoides besseyi]|nr:Mitotic spindle-associated MMXD complex subunit MIP18 [Aphelenchoides besseyi]KAI6231290.1 Mitotic spindle-associated MMXD complex subunit MIP18 [Aphelenchoides besseyi]